MRELAGVGRFVDEQVRRGRVERDEFRLGRIAWRRRADEHPNLRATHSGRFGFGVGHRFIAPMNGVLQALRRINLPDWLRRRHRRARARIIRNRQAHQRAHFIGHRRIGLNGPRDGAGDDREGVAGAVFDRARGRGGDLGGIMARQRIGPNQKRIRKGGGRRGGHAEVHRVGRHVIDESVNKRIKFLVCMRYKVGHISLNLLIQTLTLLIQAANRPETGTLCLIRSLDRFNRSKERLSQSMERLSRSKEGWSRSKDWTGWSTERINRSTE